MREECATVEVLQCVIVYISLIAVSWLTLLNQNGRNEVTFATPSKETHNPSKAENGRDFRLKVCLPNDCFKL